MRTTQRGFTLVELLIAMVVSGTLAAGLGQILLQSKKTYKTQLNLSHMMEDGRYIIEILTKETRRIGYLRNRFASSMANGGQAVGPATRVFAVDNNVLGSGMSLAAGEYLRGGYSVDGFNGSFDVNKLIFRYQLNDANELSAALPDYAASPCVRNIGLDPLALDPKEDPAMYIHVVTLYLYVQFDANLNTPVLYCDAKRDRVEIVAGVVTVTNVKTSAAEPLLSNMERFLVLYGIDTDTPADAAANIYLRADNVTDWTRVVSIRPYIVVASEETLVTQNTTDYQIDGQHYVPDAPVDKRLYRVFSTTISVRNY